MPKTHQFGDLTRDVNAQTAELQAQGSTVSAMAERTTQGLTLRALMAFGDEPKPGAKEALAALRLRGIKTVRFPVTTKGLLRPWPVVWVCIRRKAKSWPRCCPVIRPPK